MYTALVMFACSSVSEAERVQALIDRNSTRQGKVDSVSKRNCVSQHCLNRLHHEYFIRIPTVYALHHHSTNIALTWPTSDKRHPLRMTHAMITIHSFHPAR